MIIPTLQEFFQLLQLHSNNLECADYSKKPIIAIDFGSKKTGIAISNPERTIAMPIKIIVEAREEYRIKEILALIYIYGACGIVVGLPISMNGQETAQTAIVIKFSEKLSTFTTLPIYLQDERLTSMAANSLLKSLGVKRRERNNRDDSIAASMILETTLDSIRKL